MLDAGVKVHAGTNIETVSGFVGNFNVHLTDGSTLDVGFNCPRDWRRALSGY